MADWLLIRFPHDPAAGVQWLVADAAGRIVTPPESGSLSQASPAAIGRKVAVLVPSPDVLRTESDIPAKAGLKLQQVVPYALEELVAEDIDELHFATGRRDPTTGRTSVAVVARRLMGTWLDELVTHGVRPDVLYAESDLLPASPTRTVALLEGETVIVRTPATAPVTMQIDLLGEALEHAAPAQPGAIDSAAAEGAGLVLYTGAAEWQRYAPLIEPLREPIGGIQVQLLTGGPLSLFAPQLAQADAVNLLQGSYAPLHSGTASLRRWRLAAMLLVGLLGLHVAGKVAELGMLKSSEKKLDQSLDETFRQVMPGEQANGNARRRMESQLLALREGQSGTGFLAALSALTQARQSAPDTRFEALSFRPGAIDLKLAAPSAGSLDKLSQSLRANGWSSDLTSGTVVGSGYEGRIQIKAPGAS